MPDDSNSGLGTTDTTTANESIAAKTYSSDMSEAGISVALAAGTKLIPYLDIAYVSEDTTKAAYSAELKDDGVTELTASDPDGYTTFGGGIILNISSTSFN